MMNGLTVPPSTRRCPHQNHPAHKPDTAERWSTVKELQDLLQYDGDLEHRTTHELFPHRHLKAGQTVLMTGQPFDRLYVVRQGTLKTMVTNADGGQHVLAFPMKGNLLGFDGVYKNSYMSDVVALTDCELIHVSGSHLPAPERIHHTPLAHMLDWACGREIIQEQESYSRARSTQAHARVAQFLHAMALRLGDLGRLPHHVALPLTRRDIGLHLSVPEKTVGQVLEVLAQQGAIAVDSRQIKILPGDALCGFNDLCLTNAYNFQQEK